MALETKKEGNIVTELVSGVKLPRMIKAKQLPGHSHTNVNEIPGVVRSELDREELGAQIKPGADVAITYGSRGVTNIAAIIRAIMDSVKECGEGSFVLPTTGSHGRTIAQGQHEILTSYHITEDTMGYPTKATIEMVQVGETPDGMSVYVDRYAYEANAIVLCGRVKAHTALRGPYESGIMKMAVIGLRKREGAEAIHHNGLCELEAVLPVIGRIVLERTSVVGVLVLVENAFDQTCIIKGMLKEEIYGEGPELLIAPKQRLGEIYFDNIDVLVVDRIGGDINGDGMNPSITRRFAAPYINEDIKVRHIAVLDLTGETHGNCNGLGLANVATKRLVDKTDVNCICPNAVTSTALCTPKTPLFIHSDKTCTQTALRTCNYIDREHPRVAKIKDTMDLEEIYIPEFMLKEAEESNHVTVSDPPKDWVSSEEENLW